MAAFKLLLFQTRRRCLSTRLLPGHPDFLRCRHFSSEPDPEATNPQPTPEFPYSNIRKPLPIQPISYPTKAKPPQSPETQSEAQSEQQTERQHIRNAVNPDARSWTRDEMRYMKDASVIAPTHYPSKVAPLPEDRIKVGEEEKGDRNEEFERERRRIDYENWSAMRRAGVLRSQEEENLPFPKLIKVENSDSSSKKKGKVVFDLKEAIQLVKANSKQSFDETLEAHVKMTPDLRRTDLMNEWRMK